MTSSLHEFDRYADVRAALADPNLVPPPAESGPVGSMAWLRATVARFSSGETHARRRALVQADSPAWTRSRCAGPSLPIPTMTPAGPRSGLSPTPW